MDGDALFAEVVEKYAEYVNPSLARLLSFAGFGVETRAEGCYLYDQDDRAILDCLGGYGVFSLGHRHPRVVEAVKAQLDRMPLSGKAFFSKPQADLAEKLAAITPGDLQFTFFCNSGAEAVEGALKFAKGATGRPKIVSTFGGFHGKTLGALSTTGKKKYREPFEPLLPGVEFVPYGDGPAMANAVDGQTAAVIVEPLQGEGGIVVPPDGYLKEVRDACTAQGALMIADEVQTGLGRTGRMFGCDWDGVAPDLMTLAKALGGGVMPIGAVIGTAAVWEAIYGDKPLSHTSTFGGNPMACAAALAGIEVLETEGLLANAEAMGSLLRAELANVRAAHPDLLCDVRGRGLMIGVEFTQDEVGELVVAQMLKRGLCAAYTLNNPRVMRFEPPLIIDEAQVRFAASTFGEALAETAEMLAAFA
ncbi:MAG: aspartate aminotransferase family protein [Fimbriimonadaceae bacterium]|nr:aspartate aminotransferase family protein [Fimbriimonadaceae bacterium]